MKARAPIKGYWAKRGGGFLAKDGILTIKGKRGGPSTSSSGGRPKHYTAILVAHAAGYGYYNGRRIKPLGGRDANNHR